MVVVLTLDHKTESHSSVFASAEQSPTCTHSAALKPSARHAGSLMIPNEGQRGFSTRQCNPISSVGAVPPTTNSLDPELQVT